MSLRILVVEDDPSQREIMSLLLRRRLGYTAVPAQDGRTALSILKTDPDIRLVILDVGLPEMNGLEVLDLITQRHPDLPVIMLTGSRDIDVAVGAMKAGARDFLTKPPEKERLDVAVRNALKTSLLEKEVVRLKKSEEGAFSFDQLIGYDGGLSRIVAQGRKAASSDIPILLTGETGTGKEIFARAIHGESHRIGRPFVAVNCGAIPAQLIESTLFGHEKGAFTGAISKYAGKFREAEGGTIFLDEIGDLPFEAQVKILRVLQQKEISPIGGEKTVPVNVRVISATNRNLEASVEEGRFRDDLYFRLNVLSIHMPPLRERREDIPALVRHFVERFAAAESRSLKSVSPEALTFLTSRSWPGNVRELENIVHRTMVLCDREILGPSDFLSSSSLTCGAQGAIDPEKTGSPTSVSLTGPGGNLRTLEDIEREAMEMSLKFHAGNVTRAAQALGVAKSTFYRRIQDLRGKNPDT